MADADVLLHRGNRTDAGRVRESNEDFLGAATVDGRHLIVVADGMGGEEGGEVASRLAVTAVLESLARTRTSPPVDALREMFAAANQACLEAKRERPELELMGTTLVLLLLEGPKAWWGHVGDSRLYRVRKRKIVQLTRDHTVVQQMIDEGLLGAKQAAASPRRHVLQRVVGREAEVKPDVQVEPAEVQEGDAFVLCTDGLTDALTDQDIGRLVRRHGPVRGCEELVALANARGGPDNVTVQIVHCGPPRRRWAREARSRAVPGDGRSPLRRRLVLGAWVLLGAALLGVAAWLTYQMRHR